jgi:peptidoglycan-associated lipoprotein
MTDVEPLLLMPLNKSHSSFRHVTGRFRSCLLLAFAALSLALLSGCPSKTPVAQAPPPPPPPAPTATIEAAPATVQPGQPVVLTWKTENATDVSIDSVGAVPASGSKTVTPSESTTYRLTAKGPGGVKESDARITVLATAAQGLTNNSEEALATEEATRLDVFFDSDDYSIRPDQFVTIKNDAAFLKEHPEVKIVVAGHCDEKGSTEYNLALGDRRAAEVKSALEKAGVSPNRMRAISYGKEQPFCQEESDACWKLNRRAHLEILTQKESVN